MPSKFDHEDNLFRLLAKSRDFPRNRRFLVTKRPQSRRALVAHIFRQISFFAFNKSSRLLRSILRSNRIARGVFLRILGLTSVTELPTKPTLSPSGNHHQKTSWDAILSWANEASVLMAQGDYRGGVALRLNAISETYLKLGLSPNTHSPGGLALAYSTNMGHIGLAGAIAHANRQGYVPKKTRVQPIRQIGNREALQALANSYDQIYLGTKPNPLYSLGDYDTEPSIWPFLERLHTIRTSSGLKDLYQVLEDVGNAFPPRREESVFQVAADYSLWARDQLSKYGLSETDPIVGLHIRELPAGKLDHRTASLSRYLPAVDFLLKRGFKVVRFGSSWMTPLPKMDGLIDLARIPEHMNELDFAVLHSSEFLISTLSGPAVCANWMGIPTLVTNTTSLGRNALSGVLHNRYLPKRFLGTDGRVMSLSQTLNSPFAYWEGELSHLAPKPPVTLDSTASEILEGTKEMLSLLSGQPDPFLELHSRASAVRKERNAVGLGKFSGSFLSRNENWIS